MARKKVSPVGGASGEHASNAPGSASGEPNPYPPGSAAAPERMRPAGAYAPEYAPDYDPDGATRAAGSAGSAAGYAAEYVQAGSYAAEYLCPAGAPRAAASAPAPAAAYAPATRAHTESLSARAPRAAHPAPVAHPSKVSAPAPSLTAASLSDASLSAASSGVPAVSAAKAPSNAMAVSGTPGGTPKAFEFRRSNSFSRLGSSQRLRAAPSQEFAANPLHDKLFALMANCTPNDVDSVQRDVVHHVEHTLCCTRFSMDRASVYRAAAHALRDRLVESFNDTNAVLGDGKRAYYFSLEFLLGRFFQNNVVSLDLEENFALALEGLGFRMEELYEQERDPALGNGGLGRLAACFLDSMAALDLPAWGYGIRYTYGIFEQRIVDGRQREGPDYWLQNTNPWEVERPDVTYPVQFGGWCEPDRSRGGEEMSFEDSRRPFAWHALHTLRAMAYDVPVPGFDTPHCNNLRLWRSLPSEEFDFDKFNDGNFTAAAEERRFAEDITSVLYPNDNSEEGKKLRLRQQFFFVTASLQDIIRRFKKPFLRAGEAVAWEKFPDKAQVQLNDTHPAIAVPELMRVLVDVEGVAWERAWTVSVKVFAYTNHTVLPEALERWSRGLLGELLPRHLRIIEAINYEFLERVQTQYAKAVARGGAKAVPYSLDHMLRAMSIFDHAGNCDFVRMANLSIVGAHHVNGVAAIHSEIIKKSIFNEFYIYYKLCESNSKTGGDKFINLTNGVTPRRWIYCANKPLATLISMTVGHDGWMKDLSLLRVLNDSAASPQFQTAWTSVKHRSKRALAALIAKRCDDDSLLRTSDAGGMDLDDTIFDVQVKRIHLYKRQQMFIFWIVRRYLQLKEAVRAELQVTRSTVLSAASVKKIQSRFPPRLCVIGGKAAPGYFDAKTVIVFANTVGATINADTETSRFLRLYFFPNYNVSSAQVIIPASDVSQHISLAGTEASGTSNMKFVMNGGTIVGTLDGANVEILEECGPQSMFVFGERVAGVEAARARARAGQYPLCTALQQVYAAVMDESQADPARRRFACGCADKQLQVEGLLNMLRTNGNGSIGDYYLTLHDFAAYDEAMCSVDLAWQDKPSWARRSIACTAGSGKFSTDRTIAQYADRVWNLKPLEHKQQMV